MAKAKKPVIRRMIVNEQKRMFDAALPDRLTLSWDSTSYSIDQIIYSQLDILRARARQQARNNDYVIKLIRALQNNIVGAVGFKLRAKMTTKQGKPNKSVRKNIEAKWKAYDEQVGLVDIEKLIISTLTTDGEAFVYQRVDVKGQLLPELIDPVRIDIQFNEALQTGNRVIMGIEYDSNMIPVAYHINDNYEIVHPGFGAMAYSGSRTRIEARHILHIFEKFYAGQKRGIPWISPSMGRLFQLNRAEDASVTAFRIGAAKMGFFYSDGDDGQYEGDGESGDMMMNAEAGSFENIGRLKFQAFDPQFPNGEVAPFVERMLKGISSGWGIDYHTLANDLSNVNYSSARVGMLETREFYKSLQTWFVRSFLKPLFLKWIQISKFRGDFGLSPLSDEAYCCVSFVGRRWDWVDPQKEATAKQTLYNLRVISLSQIIRERGDEPEEVFAEIAEENELLKQYGITAEQVLEKVSPSAPDEDKDEQKESPASSNEAKSTE